MKRFLLFLFLFVIKVPTFAQELTFSHLSGTIGGKYKVEMEFTRRSDTVSGSYRYIGKKDVLTISGRVKGQTMTLTEFSGVKTGEWQGTLGNDGSYAGTWTSGDGKRKLPFSLNADNTMGLSGYSWSGRADSTYASGSCVVEIDGYFISDSGPGVKDLINQDMNGVNFQPENSNDAAVEILVNESDWLAEENTNGTDSEDYYSSRFFVLNFYSHSNVTWNLAGVFCVETNASGYGGGAHGWYNISYNCYNTQSGKRISADDIFLPGYKDTVLAHASNHYTEPGGDPSYEELIELSPDFYINEKGITFVYNPCYVCYIWEAFVAWEDVSKWIDPNGPMGWVVK